MKTVLLLAQLPESVSAVEAALNPEVYRIVHRIDVQQADPLLNSNLVDCCILDVDQLQMEGFWAVEKIRNRLPHTPLIVLTGAAPWEWTEEAYLQGVAHVVAKPVRARLLQALIERTESAAPTLPIHPSLPPAPPARSPRDEPGHARPSLESVGAVTTLKALHGFSTLLTHSLKEDAMLRQFLILLREIIGVNRAAIFLRQPAENVDAQAPVAQGRGFRAACALGLAPGLLEHFELSFATGIGGQVVRQGRILRRDSPEAGRDPSIQKEFELLCAEVVVPILDRENIIGLAALDGRITGASLSNEELELIFHLLEQLGMAVRNIWLHDQLQSHHELLADVLTHLSSACVVVSHELSVLHINHAAKKLFGKSTHRKAGLQFSDLPQLLGSKIFQVLQTGGALASFRFTGEEPGSPILQVTVVPIQKLGGAPPASVLMVAEDRTQAEQLRHLELEAENLRLVRRMADRLAHEIGNAMVPLATHQQLLGERFRDAEFRDSLETAMGEGVRRVTRLVHQMRYLAREDVLQSDAFPLTPLLEEAFKEAHKQQPVKSARLKYEENRQPVILTGDRSALKHAFAEVMINALQANTGNASIGINLQDLNMDNGHPCVTIEFEDNGTGFPKEVEDKVPSPFVTTRSIGLGLGLCVTRKIVEMHHGRLEIVPSEKNAHGRVRITLPAQLGAADEEPTS